MKKIIELIGLFVFIPAVLVLEFDPMLKAVIILLAVIYVSWLAFYKEKISFKKEFHLKGTGFFWKTIGVRFLVILLLTTSFLYFFKPQDLFNVVRTNIPLWIIFTLIYSFLSVIPQEFIYRTFFFKRYKELFKTDKVFMLVNVMLFSFAHIWFMSWVVLAFTFVGGYLFFITYKKTNSLLVLCIEHAIYGSWLYTVGYGELFKFPIA